MQLFSLGLQQMECQNCVDLFPWRMFSKPSRETLLTMPLFFSTGSHGYLYDVYNSGTLITSYDYISDCHGAVHTNSMLYTLTSNGLEVYTSRLYPFAAAQCCQFAKDNETVSENVHYNSTGVLFYIF